jgi:tetratricopeptide (TPR) repeat protein
MNSSAVAHGNLGPVVNDSLASALLRARRYDEALAQARRTLAELEALSRQIPVSPFNVALIYAALGERDQAFAWLDKAYQSRACELVQLKADVRFDSLRGDPRFAALLARIGLPS